MTTVTEDRHQTRIHELLDDLRDAEADWRRCYARVLTVVADLDVADLDQEQAGAATGFGSTARLLAGVLNLSPSEARARADQAQLLTPRRSLTGEVLPATTAELSAGAISPAQLRVITATLRRLPPVDPSRGGRAGRADPRARRAPVRPRCPDPDR